MQKEHRVHRSRGVDQAEDDGIGRSMRAVLAGDLHFLVGEGF